MTSNEFANLAMTFGADIRRWPDAQHAEARRLLKAAPDLLGNLVATAAFDAAIADARPQISDARLNRLRERIFARAPRLVLRRAPLVVRLFASLATQEFTSVAAGIGVALVVTTAIQFTRPPPAVDSPAPVNPIVALLDSDTSLPEVP